MDMPLSGMVDHSGPNLYKLPYYRVYEWLDALAPERRIPDHVERIAGKTSDEKPGLISLKLHAPRGSSCPISGCSSLLLSGFRSQPDHCRS